MCCSRMTRKKQTESLKIFDKKEAAKKVGSIFILLLPEGGELELLTTF